ncbi:MAG: hypothetical protein Crog4KO_10280 [Crocinitomicaceae bacterium]
MLQYVEKLFQETKTIILPGLGALTITNPDTKELMFMPFLKHDDGALASFIEKEAGISGEEAKKMVSDEVNAILNDLEAGKAVAFGTFGSFNKGADGDVEFENGGRDAQPLATDAVGSSKAEEEAVEKKAKEEAEAKKAAEAEKKAKEEADAKKAADAEAKKKAQEEADAKKAADAEAKKKVKEEADAKKAADAEAKKKTKEEADAKIAADAEAKKKTKEEADAKIAADAEAKKKAKEEADAKKTAEAKKKEETKKDVVVPPVAPVSEKPKPSRATVNEVIPDSADSKEVNNEKNILEKEEIAANQKKLNDLKKQKEEPKKKRKRGVGFYILMVLLVLIISGGTLVALNYEKAKEYLPFLKEETATVSDGDEEMDKLDELVGGDEQAKTDVSSDEEITEDENLDEEGTSEKGSENDPEIVEETSEAVEPTPDPKPQVTGSNNQPFHIIAGAFGDPSNADRMVEKLKGMGYPSKTISRGAQTLVSVQSYATRSEAQAAISSVSDAAPSGWILEWR